MKKKVTVGYYTAFIALGLTVAALGPTLPGLAEQTNTQLSQISILFTARSLGFLIGALLMGQLYDRLPGHQLMAVAVILMAITVALVPTISILWVLTLVLFLMGLFEPGIDVGGNTLIVWLHRDKVGPYMNGLHFFFGVGAFVSPVIVAWVISQTEGIAWAYWILAILILVPAFYLVSLPNPTATQRTDTDAVGHTSSLIIILIAFFFFLYGGAEVSYGGWIFTYVTRQQIASEEAAALLTSAFWGMLTVGRLLAIPIAARLRNRTIIFIDLAGCLLSMGLILLLPTSLTAVWIGTMGLGLSMASVFPTTLSLAERHLHVSGQTTSYFFAGASIGAMIFPWVIGQQFETVGPEAVITIITLCLAAAAVVFGILMKQIAGLSLMTPKDVDKIKVGD